MTSVCGALEKGMFRARADIVTLRILLNTGCLERGLVCNVENTVEHGMFRARDGNVTLRMLNTECLERGLVCHVENVLNTFSQGNPALQEMKLKWQNEQFEDLLEVF